MKYSTSVGLDVHKSSISVAVVHDYSVEPEHLGNISNSPDSISKLLKNSLTLKKRSSATKLDPAVMESITKLFLPELPVL